MELWYSLVDLEVEVTGGGVSPSFSWNFFYLHPTVNQFIPFKGSRLPIWAENVPSNIANDPWNFPDESFLERVI